MRADYKRKEQDDMVSVQAGNKQWWTEQTMSYDWKGRIGSEKFSLQWYNEIDRRFIFAARLFAHKTFPFDEIIPFPRIKDQAVLEIGCGMGLHTELMIRAGASVTAIDISNTSVNGTRRRLELKGLSANVQQMDACRLAYSDAAFDLVWSWGVIHHSAQTGLIIREIQRVLKPGGEARVMVYNLEGASAYVTIVRDYLTGFWRGKTLDQCLWNRSDGYMARYYTRDALSDIFRIFFDEVAVESFGQDADAVPVPGFLRRPILRFVPSQKLKSWANRRGSFLFVTAKKDKPKPIYRPS
jgi:2-polyprenyl-3-methyl-5-hydroxy-6-metoxy-1,4-benzoquinol methylase